MSVRIISASLLILFSVGIAQAQQRGFPPEGVELSAEQQTQIEKIRGELEARLNELRQQRNAVYTNEQRQARRDAFRKARDENKDQQQTRQAVEAAVKLTDEQRAKLAELRELQAKTQAEMQQVLTAVLTDEQRRQLRGRNTQRDNLQGRRPRTPPTHANVQYGPHERNVMDVWLAESDQPTPVLVSIHGGGFRGGNKSVDPALLKACLDAGISVAAITYRLSQQAIAPAPFHDSARAIQFIRSKANDWNLDRERFAATGGSAGAGISLWLAFHDDLATPDSDDPIARQSTRLRCAAVYNGQTSYDPRVIRKLFPENDTYKHAALAQLYDVDLNDLDALPKEKFALFEECSALPHVTKDDAPALLFYGVDYDTPITNHGVGIHHPRFGKMLKEKMDEQGIECIVRTRSQRGSGSHAEQTLAFIQKHFGK